jgi:hypothetical protein
VRPFFACNDAVIQDLRFSFANVSSRPHLILSERGPLL